MPEFEQRAPESCQYRNSVQSEKDEESAICGLVQEETMAAPELCRVSRRACLACCQSEWPCVNSANAVIVSLVYGVATEMVELGEVDGCNIEEAQRIRDNATNRLQWLPRDLESAIIPARVKRACCFRGDEVRSTNRQAVFECLHPAHSEATYERCRKCRDWAPIQLVNRIPLARMIPLPEMRCGTRVKKWSVGVTTAPRLESTLMWCLESLARAGWNDPQLFLDAGVKAPPEFGSFSSTQRDAKVGPWPNFYLALTELVMQRPDADAYLMLQDDAYLYDSADVRGYLEAILWPGSEPGLISLFSTEVNSADTPGWHSDQYPWLCGAQAFIFSPDAAQQFLADQSVLRHRWVGPRNGTAGIDGLIGRWAASSGIPVWYPMPSLVQHVGNTSTIQRNATLEGPRRSRWFAGDLETAFQVESSLASFGESEFPPSERPTDYWQRVDAGKTHMRQRRAVICGLARDVRIWLPRTIARIEQLGSMFRECQIVIFENDSRDGTLEFLQDWRDQRSNVHILSEHLGFPKFPQTRSSERANRLARCRNRYRDYMLEKWADYEYAIVVDTDLRGGWSYEGAANTFGHHEWDFVGSYGILHGAGNEEIPTSRHFDAWAFRSVGNMEPHDAAEVDRVRLNRGQPLFPIWSCFGGLGIYRMACFRGARYAGEDCEHVQLHAEMRRRGFDRLFLNPSQITVY